MKVNIVGKVMEKIYTCEREWGNIFLPKKYVVYGKAKPKLYATIKACDEQEFDFSVEGGDFIVVDNEELRVEKVVKLIEQNTLCVVTNKVFSTEDNMESLYESYKEKSEKLEGHVTDLLIDKKRLEEYRERSVIPYLIGITTIIAIAALITYVIVN